MSGTETRKTIESRSIFLDDDQYRCCDSMKIVETRPGINTCVNCGMDHGVEIVSMGRRAYDFLEISERVNHEPMSPWQIASNITVDYKGKYCPKNRMDWVRMARVNGWRSDRVISSRVRHVTLMSGKLNLPRHVMETGTRLMVEASNRGIMRGRSIEEVEMACLYYSARVNKFPFSIISFNEMEEFKDKIKGFRACLKHVKSIARELYGNVEESASERLKKLVVKKANEMGMPVFLQGKCLSLYDDILKKGYNADGKNPLVLVGAIIFVTCKAFKYLVKFDGDDHLSVVTQGYVCKKIGVTEVSLRTRARDFVTISLQMEKRGIEMHPVMVRYMESRRNR